MATNERLYLLKTVDGDEYGPVDQDCLIRWAENGRVTAYCQIRSTLIARWENACEVPFLREILLQAVAEQAVTKASLWSRVKQRATMRATEAVAVNGLHEVRPDDFEAAPLGLRLAAGVVDGVAIVLWAVALFLIFALLYARRVMDADSAFYLGLLICYGLGLLGFAWLLSQAGQTPGQRFWGIILIRRTGEQFYLGRAYAYGVLTVLFGVFSPLVMFVAGSHRSLQEILTGTRMVKVKLIGKRR